MAVDPRLARWKQRVDAGLEASLALDEHLPRRLQLAMRHAVLGGGKRLRPLLVYAAGAAAGADEARLDAPALAVELVHAFSLVHDDLPAMDDDALRRGQPTVHVAFDEATAILAGDALQSLAFQVLAEAQAPAQLRVAWLAALARATGVAGMCGGQALDMEATGTAITPASLEQLHSLKTSALIRASIRMGGLGGGADDSALARLDAFARALGLAFQIRDDILDVEGDTAALGKTAGKDAAQAKATYVALLGEQGARQALEREAAAMSSALDALAGDTSGLRALAAMTVQRDH